MCYHILLQRPEGLHHEKKGTRPLNSKPEGSDLKTTA